MEPMHTWLCARVIRTTHTYRQDQGTCKHEETGCEELNSHTEGNTVTNADGWLLSLML